MTGASLDSVGAISDETSLRETIRRRVEAAGTSFYWAMRMLPQERRDGMYAVYAFCREVDDIADDWPEAERPAGLAAWHDEIEAVVGDVFLHRPVRGKSDWLVILARSIARRT